MTMDPKLEERLRGAAADSMDPPMELRYDRVLAPKATPAAGVIGWTRYSWTKPARRCVKCSRKVTTGIVRIGHKGRETDPIFRVLCSSCYSELLETPEPEVWE